MSAPCPLEEQLLKAASVALDKITVTFTEQARYEARLQILECAAARLGAFSVSDYFNSFGISPLFELGTLGTHAALLLEKLNLLPMHPALALSSLACQPVTRHAKRETGAYYTDFRLANYVAEHSKNVWMETKPIVDPACGAGILLVATTIAICGADRQKTAEFLASKVIAADASTIALRGACLALASLTNDLDSIVKMRSRWLCGDSLLRKETDWLAVAPDGFGLVVANPPWEKIKITRHEFVKASGKKRHYGADHVDDDFVGLETERMRAAAYSKELAGRYPLAANGEMDLYIAFVDLFLHLAKNGGGISALVPAGLIRSEGTASLRKELLSTAKKLEITVFENRSRFFAIDTRFKFLGLAMQTRTLDDNSGARNLKLVHASGTDTAVVVTGQANIGCSILKKLRSDLTVPEVHTSKEWSLFAKMAGNGIKWHADTGPWASDFCREVDMTKEKGSFYSSPAESMLPVIEGRMIHQHRYGAKKYISGTGRKAIWAPLPMGSSEISPQYWIPTGAIPRKAKERADYLRAGFCDITGQTNERSMMASLIPPGVVCGNKVPTVLFPGDEGAKKLHLWVGIVNSIPFDWLMRRVVTTTVNYFLLRGVQLPDISPDSLPGKEIIKAVRALQILDIAGSSGEGAWRMAELRARIDLISLIAYGAGYDELVLMLQDFPLLDRRQPNLPGELRSTITKDYLLLGAARKFRRPTAELLKRVQEARALGAVPYIPSQSDVMEEEQNDSRVG